MLNTKPLDQKLSSAKIVAPRSASVDVDAKLIEK